MTKQTKKPVTLTKVQRDIAVEIGAAISKQESLSAAIGALVIKAGRSRGMTLERIDAFANACRDAVTDGVSENSVKVYLSNIRGVLRDMVSKDYKPADGETLRNMYANRPSARKHSTTGAQTVDKETRAGKNGAAVEIELTPEQARIAAIRVLFGTHDAELDDAVRYAAANQVSFMRWVKANIQAAALNAADKALTAKPAKKAAKKAA